MNDTYDFLAKLPLFDRLTEEEVDSLAAISREYSFDDGSIIAYQRDVADSFYLVKDGRLYAEKVGKDGVVRDSKPYKKEDCFEQTWLFEQAAHTHTIRGTGNGRLLIINQKDFLHFLKDNPDVISGLEPFYDESGKHVAGLSEEAWEMAQRTSIKADKPSKSVELLPDELIEFYTRRSKWYLFVQMILPTLGVLLGLTLAVILLTTNGLSGMFTFLNWLLPALILLLSVSVILFRLVDWRNDYFIITNKHLTHNEFELTKLRGRVNKIPIDQIQSISTLKPSFFANLFNYGTARITTASQSGSLYFDNIDHPETVTTTLERLQIRSQNLTAGLIQAAMRRSLENHFQVDPLYQQVEGETAAADTKGAESATKNLRRNIKHRYGTHLIEEGVITYRKNFFAFLRTIIWPFILNIFIFLLLGILIITYGKELPISWTSSGILFVLFFSVGWLIWQVEDWRNDHFQLTDQYVIDIDRKPFGISEARKQAGLDNVQNVTANKPSFWATLFNYGDVHIETAGAVADIIFEQVSHPNRVQSEIFQRLEQYKQRAKVNEGTRRRQEYAVLMDVYQQATEQNVLPRRTPK